MNIEKFINAWIEAGNAYDTEKYLSFFLDEAVLNDPSVGKKFVGKEEIKQYFETYFIGYKTHSEKVAVHVPTANTADVEVVFTGDFPEGRLGGIFDITFKDEKIFYITADLKP